MISLGPSSRGYVSGFLDVRTLIHIKNVSDTMAAVITPAINP